MRSAHLVYESTLSQTFELILELKVPDSYNFQFNLTGRY